MIVTGHSDWSNAVLVATVVPVVSTGSKLEANVDLHSGDHVIPVRLKIRLWGVLKWGYPTTDGFFYGFLRFLMVYR